MMQEHDRPERDSPFLWDDDYDDLDHDDGDYFRPEPPRVRRRRKHDDDDEEYEEPRAVVRRRKKHRDDDDEEYEIPKVMDVCTLSRRHQVMGC
jgi:hypothetical protein